MLALTKEHDLDIYSGLVAVKFEASWCGPCKRLEPSIIKMEKEFNKYIKFVTVDIDSVPSLAQKFRVRTLPTVILLKNGKEINRITGVVLMDPLRTSFKDFVGC